MRVDHRPGGRPVFRLLCCALAAVLFAGPAAPSPSNAAPRGADRPGGPDFLRGAIYEGLKEDGVSPRLAAQLAENPDFVPKCLICDATISALKKYAELTEAPA